MTTKKGSSWEVQEQAGRLLYGGNVRFVVNGEGQVDQFLSFRQSLGAKRGALSGTSSLRNP
ncbi:MAG: hypothetical protein ACYC4U_06375 [Pirellulaceae bacterium]